VRTQRRGVLSTVLVNEPESAWTTEAGFDIFPGPAMVHAAAGPGDERDA
jgi:hypothetical protein